MHHIAIFASGSGSNAENIAKYFRAHPTIRVSMILSNNPGAFVLERARNLDIPSVVFNRDDLYRSGKVVKLLEQNGITFIVLAGFLWLVPGNLIKAYPNRIVNIHPALLPKYGGKGMYGERVHQAVIEAGEKKTGISIHYVNDQYDDGQIIFQDSFEIQKGDTAESIADKVHKLEYQNFPVVIERLITGAL